MQTQYAQPNQSEWTAEKLKDIFRHDTAKGYIFDLLTSNFGIRPVTPDKELIEIAMRTARDLTANLLRRRWLITPNEATLHEVDIASAINKLGLRDGGEHPLTITRKLAEASQYCPIWLRRDSRFFDDQFLRIKQVSQTQAEEGRGFHYRVSKQNVDRHGTHY